MSAALIHLSMLELRDAARRPVVITDEVLARAVDPVAQAAIELLKQRQSIRKVAAETGMTRMGVWRLRNTIRAQIPTGVPLQSGTDPGASPC